MPDRQTSLVFIRTLTEMVEADRATKKNRVLRQYQIYADRFLLRGANDRGAGAPPARDVEHSGSVNDRT